MFGGRLQQLFGHPGEVRLDQPELRQRVLEMGVEAGGDEQNIGRECVERRQDALLVGAAELARPSSPA